MSLNPQRIAQRRMRGRLTIVSVGFGGLCGECNEIHDPDPNPFIYTVGLTEERRPELLLIAPGADMEVVPLGAATQRYGRDGYRIVQVLFYDFAGRLQDDPACVIGSPSLPGE